MVGEPVMHHPALGFRFAVDFDGGDPAIGPSAADLQFLEVSGLAAELETVTLVEGGENRFAHRLPGRVKHGNLVLKRGHVADSALARWVEDAAQGVGVNPVDVTVKLLDEQHAVLEQWTFVRAWPVKWSLSSFDATKNAYVVDTLELAYQRFERRSG